MNLVSLHRLDDAYARLNVLLERNPNADLYIQAAILAANRKEACFRYRRLRRKGIRQGTGNSGAGRQ